MQARMVFRIVAAGLVLLIAVPYVILTATNQWDFRTYYLAARSFRSGLDPYVTENLSKLAGSHIELPYLYPPAPLFLLVPLSFVPFSLASLVWLAGKSIL